MHRQARLDCSPFFVPSTRSAGACGLSRRRLTGLLRPKEAPFADEPHMVIREEDGWEMFRPRSYATASCCQTFRARAIPVRSGSPHDDQPVHRRFTSDTCPTRSRRFSGFACPPSRHIGPIPLMLTMTSSHIPFTCPPTAIFQDQVLSACIASSLLHPPVSKKTEIAVIRRHFRNPELTLTFSS